MVLSCQKAPCSLRYLSYLFKIIFMIDHASVNVSNYEKSKVFYSAALAPLGYTLVMDVPEHKAAGFGRNGKPDFWISEKSATTGVHVAILAETRDMIVKFHAAALSAGGTDNGAPGVRPMYHPDYYGAFIFDFDGNNIEVVKHQAE